MESTQVFRKLFDYNFIQVRFFIFYETLSASLLLPFGHVFLEISL